MEEKSLQHDEEFIINQYARGKKFLSLLVSVFLRDRDIYIVAGINVSIVYLMGQYYNLSELVDFSLYSTLLYMVVCGTLVILIILLFRFLIISLIKRSLNPLRELTFRIKNIVQQPQEVIGFYSLFVVMHVTGAAFTSLKYMISKIHYYEFDTLFANIDRVLHFGVAPWSITHSIFGSPLAISAFAFFYNLWFLVMFAGMLYFILELKNIQLRKQFLVSYILCWFLIGNVAALLLSSVGPCYAQLIDPSITEYSELLAQLQNQKIWLEEFAFFPIGLSPTAIQEMLWGYFQNNTPSLGSGLSAMPSMHVSIAVLIALAANRVNNKMGQLFWVYAAIIQIGSVHLGWHYAIDGYVSTLLTILIWKVVSYWYARKNNSEETSSSIIRVELR